MIKSKIRLLAYAGVAKPNPKMGQALGPLGINMMKFCKEFNDKTKQYNSDVLLRIKLQSFTDRTFKFQIYSPPTSWFIKKSIGQEKLSGHRAIKSGEIGVKYIYEIAKIKKEMDPQFKEQDLQSICKSIASQCKTMNVDVVFNSEQPKEVIIPMSKVQLILII